MKKVQLARRQHEREVLDAELVREQLGVSRPLVTARMHRGFVERRGDDARHLAHLRKRAGFDDESIRGVAGDAADFANGNILQRRPDLNQIDARGIVDGLSRIADDANGGRIAAHRLHTATHRVRVANDDRYAFGREDPRGQAMSSR